VALLRLTQFASDMLQYENGSRGLISNTFIVTWLRTNNSISPTMSEIVRDAGAIAFMPQLGKTVKGKQEILLRYGLPGRCGPPRCEPRIGIRGRHRNLEGFQRDWIPIPVFTGMRSYNRTDDKAAVSQTGALFFSRKHLLLRRGDLRALEFSQTAQ
jgi:hypothetical protein